MSSRHIQSQVDFNSLSRLENLRIADEPSVHLSSAAISSSPLLPKQQQQQQNKIGIPPSIANRPLPNINYSCVNSVASNYYPSYDYLPTQHYASGAPIYENIDLYEPTYVTRKAIEPQVAHEKQLSYTDSVSSYPVHRNTDKMLKTDVRTNEEAARFAHTPQPSDIELTAPIYENLSKGAGKYLHTK